jgi:hypothetical protein
MHAFLIAIFARISRSVRLPPVVGSFIRQRLPVRDEAIRPGRNLRLSRHSTVLFAYGPGWRALVREKTEGSGSAPTALDAHHGRLRGSTRRWSARAGARSTFTI